MKLLWHYTPLAAPDLRPDLTLLLEADESQVAERLAERDGDSSDAIGGRDIAYHRAVTAAFRRYAEEDPDWICRDRCKRYARRSSHPDLERAHAFAGKLNGMDWPNHTAAWREWRDASAGARMHHGWILAGKAGLGKHDFALQAARELVSEEGVPQPSGEHPDIHVLTYGPKDDKAARAAADGKDYERARSIRIGQIRGMQQRLNTRPSVGSRRVDHH